MALGLVAAGTANAQGIYYPRGDYPARYYEPQLPPWQIMRVVRAAGFSPLSAPVRRGPNYVITAVGRNGGYVRVVINAYEGEIVGVQPVMAARPYGAPPPYDPRMGGAVPPRSYDEPPSPYGPSSRAPGQDHSGPGAGSGPHGPGAGPHDPDAGNYGPGAGIDRGTPPLPPRTIPNPGVANAPTTDPATAVAPAPPARTPIPRPRPALASNDPPATTTAPTPAQVPSATPPAASSTDVPEAPPAPVRTRPATPMVPVAPLD